MESERERQRQRERPDGLRQSGPLISRRTLLGAAALVTLAGCAQASGARRQLAPPRPPTPPPAPPRLAITTANASAIAPLYVYTERSGLMRGVAFSPDGRLLAAGAGADILLWDMRDPQFRATWRGHTDLVWNVVWATNGALMASTSDDNTVRLWDRQRSTALMTLRDQQGEGPLSVAWAPDGKRLATTTFNGMVLIWDATTGAQVARWSALPTVGRGEGGRYPFAGWGISWSPDGQTIVSTRYDGYIFLWDVATGHSIVTPKSGFQPNRVAWAPDGMLFALTDDQGALQIWRPRGSAPMRSLLAQEADGWSYGVAWSPDGAMLAVSRESGLVEVWNAANGTRLASLTGHTASAWGLAWSPDGLRLASAGDDGSTRLWGIR